MLHTLSQFATMPDAVLAMTDNTCLKWRVFSGDKRYVLWDVGLDKAVAYFNHLVLPFVVPSGQILYVNSDRRVGDKYLFVVS